MVIIFYDSYRYIHHAIFRYDLSINGEIIVKFGWISGCSYDYETNCKHNFVKRV